MDSTMEGGGRSSEGGQLSRTKLTDVTLTDGKRPRYVDRAPFIDYATRAGVDFGKLIQLPIWAGLAGYTESWYKSVIGSDLNRISTTVGRPLTQEEAQRIANHSANKCRAATYHEPMYSGLAFFLCWKGTDQSRFPFYTPQPSVVAKITKDWFPRLGIRPQYAGLVWHTMRFMSYAYLCRMGIGFFYLTGPGAIFAGGLMKDKKLESLTREISQRVKGQMAAQRQGVAIPKYPTQPVKANGDSPTEGSEQWGAEGPQSVAQQDDQGWRAKRDPPPPAPASAPEPPRRSDPPSQYDDDDDRYLFDDASPVAKPAKGKEQDASTSSGGSAWSRIRAQAATSRSREQAASGENNDAFAPRTSSWEERRQQSMQGGGYTYSQPEEEKAASRSREQAQKEFDAMLERERRNE